MGSVALKDRIEHRRRRRQAVASKQRSRLGVLLPLQEELKLVRRRLPPRRALLHLVCRRAELRDHPCDGTARRDDASRQRERLRGGFGHPAVPSSQRGGARGRVHLAERSVSRRAHSDHKRGDGRCRVGHDHTGLLDLTRGVWVC